MATKKTATAGASSSAEESSSSDLVCSGLLRHAKKHLEFLRQLHELGTTRPTTPRLNAVESLRRYQDLWLPLVCEDSSRNNNNIAMGILPLLVPPPDIAWLWHCHRLAPMQYESYCQQRFGRLLEAEAPFIFQSPPPPSSLLAVDGEEKKETEETSSSFNHAERLWKETYPNNEPFFVNVSSSDDVDSSSHNNNNDNIEVEAPASAVDDPSGMVGDYNVLAACRRQATFLWQVSRPEFPKTIPFCSKDWIGT
jgi:hypothetical protein